MSTTRNKAALTLRLTCGHKLEVDKRPNPRKAWPDSQMCETCKKKLRVVEIHGQWQAVAHLTAPSAPKKYKAKLEREFKKGG